MLRWLTRICHRLTARVRARQTARRWIAELHQMEDDWEGSDLLWECIGLWTEEDPVNHQEFLTLFREYRQWKDRMAPSDAPAGWLTA